MPSAFVVFVNKAWLGAWKGYNIFNWKEIRSWHDQRVLKKSHFENMLWGVKTHFGKLPLEWCMRNKTQQKVVFSTINVCICSAVYSTFYVGTFYCMVHTWAAKNLGFSHRVSVVVILGCFNELSFPVHLPFTLIAWYLVFFQVNFFHFH